MIKLAFKGLLARKLRTVLTGFAVVLGVAFVAGTFIFTDTIDASFKDLFERTSKGVDVSVQSKLAVEADFAAPPTMPDSTLERVQSVDGVEEAAGSVSGDVNLLDRDGKPILSNGPPTIAVTTGPERFDPLTYVEGGKPTTDDQIAIDKGTADEFDFKVGDKVTVAGRAPEQGLRRLRHRHARRLGEPRRLAARAVHAARGPAGDRPRRLRRHLGRGRGRHHARGAQGGDPEGARRRVRRAHRQGAGREAGAGPLRRARLHPHGAARLRRRRAAGRAAS